MSHWPLVVSLVDDLDRFPLTSPFYGPMRGSYYRHPLAERLEQQLQELRQQAGGIISDDAIPNIGKDGFQVNMNVAQFKPSELSVKVVDNCVVVEGKHEERQDEHGHISRHFKRRYALPKNYEGDKVMSTLSSDGVLSISVPKPAALEDKASERVVQIQQVGPAHLNIKDNSKESAPKGKDDQNGKA